MRLWPTFLATTAPVSNSKQNRHSMRSSILANFSMGFAVMVGLGILFTQLSFEQMYLGYGLKIPLATSVAFWRVIPILLLVVAVVTFVHGNQSRVHRVANRQSILVIASTAIVGI
jgi:hypothetical protein